jgi:hypothetical protein
LVEREKKKDKVALAKSVRTFCPPLQLGWLGWLAGAGQDGPNSQPGINAHPRRPAPWPWLAWLYLCSSILDLAIEYRNLCGGRFFISYFGHFNSNSSCLIGPIHVNTTWTVI